MVNERARAAERFTALRSEERARNDMIVCVRPVRRGTVLICSKRVLFDPASLATSGFWGPT